MKVFIFFLIVWLVFLTFTVVAIVFKMQWFEKRIALQTVGIAANTMTFHIENIASNRRRATSWLGICQCLTIVQAIDTKAYDNLRREVNKLVVDFPPPPIVYHKLIEHGLYTPEEATE